MNQCMYVCIEFYVSMYPVYVYNVLFVFAMCVINIREECMYRTCMYVCAECLCQLINMVTHLHCVCMYVCFAKAILCRTAHLRRAF